MEFTIVTLKSGIKSLRSLQRNETFHPTSGPFSEATILHVDQQRLIERCSASKKFVIWDVGFGAAANALAAIAALQESETEIEIHSFDKTTAPMEFALVHARDLGYLLGHEERIIRLLSEGQVQVGANIRWRLHLGDFSLRLREKAELTPPNAVFYDPYSAATNPEMWTLEQFSFLKQRLDPASGCLLTNYTRSTAVRVALLLAGFYVGTGCVIGDKAETTVAANHLDLLEHPLDRAWLERVRNSTNAAPLREAVYSKSKITEADFELLLKSPQFS
jgi:tRNA U34 5-methylaminomethyl-2-thiouridine-forming methyltransferase MnmC